MGSHHSPSFATHRGHQQPRQPGRRQSIGREVQSLQVLHQRQAGGYEARQVVLPQAKKSETGEIGETLVESSDRPDRSPSKPVGGPF